MASRNQPRGSYRGSVALSKTAWVPTRASGKSPLPLVGHTATAMGKSIFIFGGTRESDNPTTTATTTKKSTKCTNSLAILNTGGLKSWNPDVRTTGAPPTPSTGHSAVVMKYLGAEHIAIFGGEDDSNHYVNSLFFLNTETSRWARPRCTGTLPVSRSNHSAVAIDEFRMVVFGGRYLGRPLNDVYLFSLVDGKNEWSTIKTQGTSPPPRFSHRAVFYPKTKSIIVYGGSDGKSIFSDLHILDTESWTWSKPSIQCSPSARSNFAVALLDSRMYVYGGVSGGGEILGDVNFYDIAESKWYTGDIETLGVGPGTVSGSEFVVLGDSQLYTIGGEPMVTAIQMLDTSKIEAVALDSSNGGVAGSSGGSSNSAAAEAVPARVARPTSISSNIKQEAAAAPAPSNVPAAVVAPPVQQPAAPKQETQAPPKEVEPLAAPKPTHVEQVQQTSTTTQAQKPQQVPQAPQAQSNTTSQNEHKATTTAPTSAHTSTTPTAAAHTSSTNTTTAPSSSTTSSSSSSSATAEHLANLSNLAKTMEVKNKEITDLKAALQECESELSAVRKKSESITSESSREIEELQSSVEQLALRLVEMESFNVATSKQRQSAEEQLVVKTQRIEVLTLKVKDLENDIAAKYAGQVGQASDREEEKRSHRGELDKLREELAAERVENEKRRGETAELKRELEAKSADIAERNKTVESLREQNKQLRSEVHQAESRASESNERTTRLLQEELEQTKSLSEELLKSMESALNTKSKLEMELSSLKQELEKALNNEFSNKLDSKEQMAKSDRQIHELRSEVEELHSELEKSKAESVHHSKRNEELEKRYIDSQSAAATSSSSGSSELQARIHEYERSLDEKREQIEKLESEVEQWMVASEQLQKLGEEAVREVTEEAGALREEVQELSIKYEDEVRRRRDVEAELANSESKLSELDTVLGRLMNIGGNLG